jgi:hypothetical protein
MNVAKFTGILIARLPSPGHDGVFERVADPVRIHSPIREACGADRFWFGYGEKEIKQKLATETTEV